MTMKAATVSIWLMLFAAGIAADDWYERAWDENRDVFYKSGPFSGRSASEIEELVARDQIANKPATRDSVVLPEAENYDLSVPEPYFHFSIDCCKRRSVTTVAVILGSKAEMKLYGTSEDVESLYATSVIRADRYERSLATGLPTQLALALGGKQSGVVVTLSDGRQFLLVKGNQHGQGRHTIAILENHMTSDWKKVDTKVINRSTFGDFMSAGGDRYSLWSDNGNNAADRMMALS